MKRIPSWTFIPLAASLLLACSREIGQPDTPTEDKRPVIEQGSQLSCANIFVDDEMATLLEDALREGSIVTKSDKVNSIFDELGVATIERLFPDTGRFEQRRREFGLHKWYRITYDSSIPQTKAGNTISQIRGISVFEAERPVKLHEDLPFDDPYLGDQWQYYNAGAKSTWLKGADINILPVWKDYSTGRPDVIVGVVDSGIDFSHEDLTGVVDKDNSWNFSNNSRNIVAQDHGTHVAGTIGAINNNGIGVSGIAGGDAEAGIKGVTLLSCQIFSEGERKGDGARAIIWAADHGAVLVNNSWGYDFLNSDGTYDSVAAKESHELFEQPNEGEFKHSLKDAIDYFNKYAGLDENGNQEGPMAGGVVFFSAGNEGWEYGPPACYPGAVAVGAFGPSGSKAYYSNFGTRADDWVDIAAPGGDYHQAQIFSTLSGNSYGYMQGTSMACPHATGVAAVIVSALGGPGFTREMLLDRLLGASNPNLNITNARIGIPIDALGALAYGADPEIPAEVTTLDASAASNSIVATWEVTGSEDRITAHGYRLFYGTDREAVIAATAAAPGEGVSSVAVETGLAEIGETLSAAVTVDFEKTYYLKVLGYDYGLNYSGNSNIVSVVTPMNNAPVITPPTDVSNLVLKATQTLNLTISIEDPDGHDFDVSYEQGSEADSFNSTSGSSYALIIAAPRTEAGTYTGTITATDSYGKASTLTVKYTVLGNTPPVNKGSIQNILFNQLNDKRDLPLSEYFMDEDGDDLSYTFQNSAQAVVHVTSGTNNTAFLTSMDYGLAEITVTASDARNASTSQSFKVLVRQSGVEMQAYPSIVTKTLYIGTGESPQATRIRIASQTGAIFFDETLQCSAFEPASIDMTDAAPGKYTVIATFNGKEYRQGIIKQ